MPQQIKNPKGGDKNFAKGFNLSNLHYICQDEFFIGDMGSKHSKSNSRDTNGSNSEDRDSLRKSSSVHLPGSRSGTHFDQRDRTKSPEIHNVSSDDILSSPTTNNNNKNKLPTGPWSHKEITVVKLKTWIDKKQTTIDESSPGVLKYKTPHFRAYASVELPPLSEGEKLQVGWIQTCANMHFVNAYGSEGMTSWEFPEIVKGKCSMVSDADGKMYPWYGAKKELKTIKGPSDRQTVTVEMNDNFFPQVTWHIPDESYERRPRLTHIHRRQKFYTCLAVKDIINNKIYIYKSLTWSMELNIAVDPTQGQGQRAKLIGPMEQEQPKLLRKNLQLPVYALKAPNANRSQALVWRPFRGEPRIVVPPVETTLDMDEYINTTKHLRDKFAALTLNNL